MNEYTMLWLGAAWTMYMIVVVFGYALWHIGNLIWRLRHEQH